MLLQYFDKLSSGTLFGCSNLEPFTEIIILSSSLAFENGLFFAFINSDDGCNDCFNQHAHIHFCVNMFESNTQECLYQYKCASVIFTEKCNNALQFSCQIPDVNSQLTSRIFPCYSKLNP